MAEDFNSLLALLRRTTDEWGWLQPLLDDPDSAAILGGVITVFGRLGPAVDHNGAQATISGSSGGQPGTSTLTIARAASGTTGTIPAGYPFLDARGARAILQVAIVVGGGATSASLPLQTLRETELLNTEDDPGFAVAPDAPWLPASAGVLIAPAITIELVVHTPGAIGTMAFTWAVNGAQPSAPVLTSGVTFAFPIPGTSVVVTFGVGVYAQGDTWVVAPNGTVTHTVGSGPGSVTYAGVATTTFQTIGPATPIQGSAADFLSVHGGERGLQRQPGESETDYRQRIRNIPDAVSPIAVADTVQAAAQQPGLPGFLTLEPFADGADPVLKNLHGLGNFNPYFLDDDPTTAKRGFLDDPIPGDIVVDRRTAIAYMEIQAQDYLRDPNAEVFFVDDGFLDDPVLGYPDIADGVPPEMLAALLAILFDVGAKVAGGVNYDLVLKDLVDELAHGQSNANSYTLVWTMTPPGGSIWAVEEAFAGHNSATPLAAAAHHLQFDLEDGSTYQTPNFAGTYTERLPSLSQRVTAVRGYVISDGALQVNLVGWLKVVQMVL